MEGFEVHNYWIPEHDICIFSQDFCPLALDGEEQPSPFRLMKIKGVARGSQGLNSQGLQMEPILARYEPKVRRGGWSLNPAFDPELFWVHLPCQGCQVHPPN